ncbi:hypothetical protein L6452_44762 [Arctium lappa]|nr:hypothetical protein L6452_44762 [Arctium lappa]
MGRGNPNPNSQAADVQGEVPAQVPRSSNENGSNGVQVPSATLSTKPSVFGRLSVPKEKNLKYGGQWVYKEVPKDRGSTSGVVKDIGEKEGAVAAQSIALKGANDSTMEHGDQNEGKEDSREPKVNNVSAKIPTPPSGSAREIKNPMVDPMKSLPKAMLSSVLKSFTKARRGPPLTTTNSFSVLLDTNEEGSSLHGLHDGNVMGDANEDVEPQVLGESGTPTHESS